jgi:hypothetical protein
VLGQAWEEGDADEPSIMAPTVKLEIMVGDLQRIAAAARGRFRRGRWFGPGADQARMASSSSCSARSFRVRLIDRSLIEIPRERLAVHPAVCLLERH